MRSFSPRSSHIGVVSSGLSSLLLLTPGRNQTLRLWGQRLRRRVRGNSQLLVRHHGLHVHIPPPGSAPPSPTPSVSPASPTIALAMSGLWALHSSWPPPATIPLPPTIVRSPRECHLEEAGYWELFFCIKNNPVPSLPPRFSSRFNDFLQIWWE